MFVVGVKDEILKTFSHSQIDQLDKNNTIDLQTDLNQFEVNFQTNLQNHLKYKWLLESVEQRYGVIW